MLADRLPAHPSQEQLRKRAKELRDLVRSGRRDAVKMARELHPRWPGAAAFSLADAQLVLARRYGFPSWRRLREYVGVVARYGRSPQRRPAGGAEPVDEFLRLACLTYCSSWQFGAGEEADDPQRQDGARRLLAAHPGLASASIHTAAAAGDLAAARSLLATDPSLANREGGPHGWPPLLYLTFSRVGGDDAVQVAALLLSHSADPNAGYLPDGQPPPVTALSGAFHGRDDPANQPAHRHGPALARLLLDAGADPNDRKALSNACYFPHDDAGLALLLDGGLGRPSGGPWRARLGDRLPTPAALVQDELRYAARCDLLNRVRLLLRRCAETGIDINAAAPGPDPARTAYELAVVYGNPGIVDLLTRAGARTPPLDPAFELVGACLRADRQAVQLLLDGDPALAERTVKIPWWPEPLGQAALLGRPAAVRLLVSLGFPVNDRKAVPLHIAALTGDLDVVKLLVELGADPTLEASSGRTPVDWARYLHQEEVVAYLT